YTFAGPCRGTFGVSAQGDIKGELVQKQAPSVFKAVEGSLDLDNLHLAGQYTDKLRLDDLRAVVRPDEAEGFKAKLDISGVETVELTRGEVEVVACDRSSLCRGVTEGYGVFVGGVGAAGSARAPRKALRAKVGSRGRATSWGYVVLSPDFSAMSASGLNVEFQNVNYTMFDNSGRPELKATASSEGIQLTGRNLLTVRGEVQVVSSKWIRDAQEQFKVLSFEDPNPAPETPTPAILENLLLDLRLRTVTPMRANNNVFKGVEGQALLDIRGTYTDMELAGRIDVNTGVLDIALLGAQYDIQRGRVILERDYSESVIDVLALRQEPIYIDGQPRQMYLQLGGSLDSIEWSCIVQGDSSGSLSSYECAQYLVLGEGSREVAESAVRRYGGGGGLFGKPINLVGNLTKLDVDQYVKQSAPRLAPYTPELGLRLDQFGIQSEIETPTPWFESDWGSVRVGAGYTRGYPGLLLRQSANWRIRLELLDSASIEFRDSARSYYNERIIFDPLRQRKVELRFDTKLPSLR
ncbi:MAG: translocation/assembly module TamB domain-containing protein, partial [Nannocystaceae bacterium]